MLMVGGVWGMTHPDKLLVLMTRWGRWWVTVRKRPYDPAITEHNVNQLVNIWIVLRSGGWREPTLGAALNIGFDMLTLYLMFVAAGHDVSPGVLLTGYGLPLLIGKAGFCQVALASLKRQ